MKLWVHSTAPLSLLILQNGYQGQTRNIVNDAQFEQKVNEENKRQWIKNARQESQGENVIIVMRL